MTGFGGIFIVQVKGKLEACKQSDFKTYHLISTNATSLGGVESPH